MDENENIPPFYYPRGKPMDMTEEREERHTLLVRFPPHIHEYFTYYPYFDHQKKVYPLFSASSPRKKSLLPDPNDQETKRERVHSSPTKRSEFESNMTTSQSLTLLLDIPQKEFELSEAAFRAVVKQCGVPVFVTKSLYRYILSLSEEKSGIGFRQFARVWKDLKTRNHSSHSLCFDIIAQGKEMIEFADICLVITGESTIRLLVLCSFR